MNPALKRKYEAYLDRVGLMDDIWRRENEDGLHLSMFFYGTLMRNQANHWLVEALLAMGHLKFKGKSKLTSSMVLDIGGLPAMYRTMNLPRYSTVGEVYSASYVAMDIIDIFEGNGRWYGRVNIPITRTHTLNDKPLGEHLRVTSYVYHGPFIDFQGGEDTVRWYGRKKHKVNYVSDYANVLPTVMADHGKVPVHCDKGNIKLRVPGAAGAAMDAMNEAPIFKRHIFGDLPPIPDPVEELWEDADE